MDRDRSMQTLEPHALYEQLAELAQRYRHQSTHLPAQAARSPSRTVVCFHVMGCPVAVLLDELSELLEVPVCTRLPRVKPWVRGVANVRGRLTPIIDFAAFLGGELQTTPKRQRVLLVEHSNVVAGLVVDDLVGMRHFRVESYRERRDAVPPALARFVSGTFFEDSTLWAVLRPDALLNFDEFLDVAA